MVLICEQLSCLPLEKGHYINDPNTNQLSPSLNHQKLVSNLNWKLWQSSLCFKRLYPIKISPHALEIFQTTKEDSKEICQNSSCRGIWVIRVRGCVSVSLHCSILSKISTVKTEQFRNQKKNTLKCILTGEVGAVGRINSVQEKKKGDVCCAVLSHQSCPLDCSPPGSSVHAILPARILEWVALPSSRGHTNPGVKPRPFTLQADCLPSEWPGMGERWAH